MYVHESESDRLVANLAAAQDKIENLERALANARVIGAAVGIVMASTKLTYAAAFDVLARYSQAANVKVNSLAEHIVLTGDLGPYTGSGALPSGRRSA